MRYSLVLLIAAACANAASNSVVEFNRDIRPILSDRCYTCHGPDTNKRQSKLRLDIESVAKSDLGGHFAIVPGDASSSELIRRVTSDDKARRMPPAYSGAAKLSDGEIDLLTRWITQGAPWQKHWSFLTPVRPELPQVSDPSWPKDPIDRFILARLDREGLKPSPEADKRTLLRRVSFDLTGLPPTPAEVEAFLHDTSPNAYEKVVDRLLASPRYGERMAMRWLEAARYADTNGYQTDAERSMWRWRDWVIDAFNRNMPYDRFMLEQTAGDLLPNATRDQRLATGFNRNHRGNGEGGIIPEEYAVEYVVDRVDTTSTVFLGLTLGCSRCHNHKFDPFTQREYYQLFAYFNQVPERGNAFKYGNSPPTVAAPTPEQESQLADLDRKLSTAEKQAKNLEPQLASAQHKWEKTLNRTSELEWAPSRALAVHLGLNGNLGGYIASDPPHTEKSLYVIENAPTEQTWSFKGHPEWKDGESAYGAGPSKQAAEFDGKRFIDVGNVGAFGFYDSFTLSAWIDPASNSGTIVSRAPEESESKGWGLFLKDGRLSLVLAARWLDDGIRIESKEPLPLDRWSHVAFTYDGSQLASGIQLYLDGKPLAVKVNLDYLNQPFDVKEPLRIGAGFGPANRFKGRIADVRIYRSALPEQIAMLASLDSINRLAAVPAAQRNSVQSAKLRECFLDKFAPEMIRSAYAKVIDLQEQREQLIKSFPTVMVMQDSSTPRETHILQRGAYDRPGQKVDPGVPAALLPLPAGAPNNRLGLAKWLIDPANPLPARVAVNRFWQNALGTGIVKTAEDFGSQGEWPSHPELLDWLATEFVRTCWDMKALQKTIVMSATYRQSSKVSPDLLQKDPENRLLARGPRVRLSAEKVRDQALLISGLLVEKVGGPSVKPYQPAGLWKELSGGEDYKADTGEGLHRRSLYTYWKRTAPPPMMMNFDAAGREACVVRDARTNTPLQALNLMNDVTYLEAARKIGERMIREGGSTPAARIGFGFELATARKPVKREAEILLSSLSYYRDFFASDPAAATKYLAQGEAPRDEKLDAREVAAYSAVASTILNLDIAVTKE